ncbi:hypothetical protein [Blautia sp.]|uniref:hypothetical protein n=1 Tax=Blautia sp. TaxID=1955243 RepID=UPI003AB3A386
MGKITTAVFEPGSTTANTYRLWQYDYGQTLRIQGLHLPSAVEIHFSLQETGGTSVSRVGVTKDGVTDVIIPDSMLENDDATRNYDMFAFVYLTDDTSGQTEYKIKLQVKSRPKPEVFSGEENSNIFHEAVQAVRKSADKAAESEKQAEGWAHGREDLPERAQDNAEYYAGQTAADAKKTGTDRKEVERLVESVAVIDEQVVKVENLTKQAQTSATNAALSEQAAKTAETNAQTAQAGAETAEGNAELAEQGAKASEQAVERAKQLVTQMGQEVLDNKNHVDQTVQAFTLTAQQAAADVNNAGQTQTERVQSTGNSAVESVKTAQTAATQAVETAKTEAVKAVQTEGTTQTGNVSAEGEKQVQAVQAAAQEIVADREQIAQNKAGNEGLKQGKADAIVETTSGENIQIEDSSGLGVEGLRVFGKSVQDGVPTPDNPVPISNMGDKGNVKFEITGKNLWQFEESYSSEAGKMVEFVKDGTPFILPAGTYTFSCEGSFGNTDAPLFLTLEDKTKIQAFRILHNEKNFKKTFTIAKKAISVEFVSNATFDTDGTIYNIQLERNSVASSYTPYTPVQSLALATPNGLPGIKVDSGGNYTDKDGQQWICDEIDLGRGKYVQRNLVFEPNIDNVRLSNINDHNIANFAFDFPTLVSENSAYKSLCNRFRQSASLIADEKEEGFFINKRILYIRLKRDTASTEDEFKAFFKDKPIKVICKLKTPVEHDLAPEEIAGYKSLHTNHPTTVISNDESAHMEVSYVADTKNYIASKIETPLQKQITDLQNALISQKISGGGIKVTDSARLPIKGFKIFGRSAQNGVPSLENPVPIVNVGDKGAIKSEVFGGNLIDISLFEDEERSGISAKKTEDGGYRLLGKTEAGEYFVGTNVDLNLPPGHYYISDKNITPNRNFRLLVRIVDAETKIQYYQYGSFEIKEGDTVRYYFQVEPNQTADITLYPMLNAGKEKIPYEPYRKHQSLTLQTPNGLPGIKVDSGGNYTDKDGQQWICDEITDTERIQRIGRITSYNNEPIDTEYMSNSGELSTGAEVIYILKEPIVTSLATEEISMFEKMHTNYPTTTVLNDENTDMELTYTVDTQSYVDTKIAEISKAIL